MKNLLLFILVSLLFSLSSITVSAETIRIQIQPSEDAITFHHSGPYSNYNLTSWFKFPLPKNIIITKAEFCACSRSMYPGWDGDVNVSRIDNQTWSEEMEVNGFVLMPFTKSINVKNKWMVEEAYDCIDVTNLIIEDIGNDNTTIRINHMKFSDVSLHNRRIYDSTYTQMGIGDGGASPNVDLVLRGKESLDGKGPYLKITGEPVRCSLNPLTWINCLLQFLEMIRNAFVNIFGFLI